MDLRAPRLFVGTGNVLRRDDGVGVRVAELMSERCRNTLGVEVFDAGTAGHEGAVMLEGRRRVVLVDAIDAGAEPGAVFRLTPELLRENGNRAMSLHELHFMEALAETELLGTAPEEVIVYGVQIADLSIGLELSPPVEAVVERVVELAYAELLRPLGEAPLDASNAAASAAT